MELIMIGILVIVIGGLAIWVGKRLSRDQMEYEAGLEKGMDLMDDDCMELVLYAVAMHKMSESYRQGMLNGARDYWLKHTKKYLPEEKWS